MSIATSPAPRSQLEPTVLRFEHPGPEPAVILVARSATSTAIVRTWGAGETAPPPCPRAKCHVDAGNVCLVMVNDIIPDGYRPLSFGVPSRKGRFLKTTAAPGSPPARSSGSLAVALARPALNRSRLMPRPR